MSLNNIHPTAIVDPNAKLGENVKIGPYSIIGPEVIIGNGTIVESHVVIEGETIIGENNYIFEPCEAGLLTPELYGLGRFELPKLNEVTDIEAEQNAERDLEQPFAQRNSKLIPLFEEEEQEEKYF